MNRILIALATYNERENISSLIDAIFEVSPDIDVLIVDDNSPDGTAELVQMRQQAELRLKLLCRSGKLGLGTAVLAAMNYAVEHQYDFLINMDADWSHHPKYIPALISKAGEGFDVVIGSRYVPGGGVLGWPRLRRWMSWGINQYAKWMLRLKTKDNSGSFRCYRVALIEKLVSKQIISRGYSFFEEVLFHLRCLGGSFAEVPIVFADRRFGSSKINKKEAILALWIIFRLRFWGQ
ncbi:MAG: polyprenol monophosphomannose synthase [Thermoguttaceae bacterium]